MTIYLIVVANGGRRFVNETTDDAEEARELARAFGGFVVELSGEELDKVFDYA